MLASSQSGASPVPLPVRHGQIALRVRTIDELRILVGFEFLKLGAACLTRYNESQGSSEGTGA
jgi:hypothetical protein